MAAKSVITAINITNARIAVKCPPRLTIAGLSGNSDAKSFALYHMDSAGTFINFDRSAWVQERSFGYIE